jgi:hypothetical protein
MGSLSSADILALWEQGLGQSTVHRALLLLSAFTGRSAQDLARLNIGQRDLQLLELRAGMFGPQMTSLATCPACAERLELHIDIHELCSRTPNQSQSVQVLNHCGYETTFRLPTSLDLADLQPNLEVAVNRCRLVEHCVLSARRDDREIPVCDLPSDVVAVIAQRMSEADPYADIQLNATCPQCRHQWPAFLDIPSFVWREIEMLAQRLLKEVHLLASAYGWSERDILSLSPSRRQGYLSLIPQ